MYHLTPVSSNTKTGPIPVSTSTSATCPTSCPFNHGGGCYASSGPLALHWRKVTEHKRGELWEQFLEQVASLSEGQLWRHNQAGDLPGDGDTLDTKALGALVRANKGKRGFTYTHKPMRLAKARKAIASANAKGFTVNLSANSPAHADELANLGIAPVVVTVPTDAPDKGVTPQGRRWIACPAESRDSVSCASCGLCSRSDRSVIIAFHAHGSGKARVSQTVSA